MTMSLKGAGLLLLLFIVTMAAPRYAIAQAELPELLVPPVPDAAKCHDGTGPCAVLYETTENLKMKALLGGHRMATSALLGFAVRGTPLCPESLMPVKDPLPVYCALNVTGSDNISLVTGLGQFRGSVTVVVQETNAKGVPTPDSPELVIARGRFIGDMNFAPAIVNEVPLGSVVGRVVLDGFGRPAPFTGVFRLPFSLGMVGLNGYLLNAPDAAEPDMSNWIIAPVANNETAIGYPTVRFEISF
jgi:hypothetical protein